MSTPNPIPSTSTATLLAKIEALGAKIEALAARDESYIKQYWPIAAGVLIALTRFLHF